MSEPKSYPTELIQVGELLARLEIIDEDRQRMLPAIRREQFDFLVGLGCDRAQGFYIGEPMSGEEFMRRF